MTETKKRQLLLQPVGTRDNPLDEKWIENGDGLLTHVWSTPEPTSWSVGDLLVYYASGHGKLVAVMEVAGDYEDLGENQERWRYRIPVRPLLALAPEFAPTRQQTVIDWHQTYKTLSSDEFSRIVKAIADNLMRLVDETPS